MNGTALAAGISCVNEANWHPTSRVVGVGAGCGIASALIAGLFMHLYHWFRARTDRKNSIPNMELKNLDVEDLYRARKMLNLPVQDLNALDSVAKARLEKKAEKEKDYLDALENRNKTQGEVIKEQAEFIKLLKDELEYYKNARKTSAASPP
ncbi:hypothetical protein BO82DRAFT_399485 [Aspergillus uvarum CBS 121591]|uniref:Uncharacterized protein n=1 Tax=Aspergillus uvarum CBS 121591 TaxID=1448315 RepID=A0A319CG99_9EURO|nr:hypothetical protein BO82DRAFT_399485 [Aspergillus uvarum CBS 121591]PYH84655.1 hypothetical protein BO82DRAFT_399485 [Aspergillus uvarum CBS 121591]